MRDAWQLLQIEPTDDARAIKAAYARLLRNTRPDDDAAAYQALREAYDRALAWAKRPVAEPARVLDTPAPNQARAESPEQSEPADAPRWQAARAHESPATAHVEPEVPQWDARTPEPEPPPDSVLPPSDDIGSLHSTPDALVARARTAFRGGGYTALHAVWNLLEQGLDRLPFEAGEYASSAFAIWVLEEPTLPSSVLLRLQERFHWSDDFRATAALPRELSYKLTTRMAVARSVPDDESLRWNAALLKRLRLESGWRSSWRLAWLDALAPRNWRAFHEPSFAEMLAIAGANPSEQLALTGAARAGSRLRMGAAFIFAFLLGALVLAPGEHAAEPLLAGLVFGGACFGGYLVAQFVARIMLGLLDRFSQGLPEKLRKYRGAHLLADGCVTLLALFAGALATLPPTAPLARVMTGMWARLPEALAMLAGMLWLLAHRSEASLGPPAMGFALGLWSAPMRAENHPGAAGYMALLWLGAAGLALEVLVRTHHRYGDRLRALRSNVKHLALAVAVLGAPLLLALLFLAPALPTALHRKHGPVAGFAPFCVPLAFGSFIDEQPVLVTLSLAAASLVLFGAQELMTRAARRMIG